MNDAIPTARGRRSHLFIRFGTVVLAALLLMTAALMWW